MDRKIAKSSPPSPSGRIATIAEAEKIFSKIAAILDRARTNVVRNVNSEMVLAYWHIGREIVEHVQLGEGRAEYGQRVLEALSERLVRQYGKGFSVTNLRYFRLFYQVYADRTPEIRHKPCDESISKTRQKKHRKACDVLDDLSLALEQADRLRGFASGLSWSHYRTLTKVEHRAERLFYEIEAEKEGWSVPRLERQIHTMLFARLFKSRNKAGVLALATRGQVIEKPIDALKDPYVLDFLDLPEGERLHETAMESAIIAKLQTFLLELGKGFAFVARQKRLTYEDEHFYVDLVFYNYLLRCFVLIDLKVGKLTHQDIGQMDSYVRLFDDTCTAEGDNPTVGLILCAEKNATIAKYSVLSETKQIFAAKYLKYLPSEAELKRELERERRLIELHGSGAEKPPAGTGPVGEGV
jgi:predicted nuclease of restriction endonuclease-like (RecB) superfamily